MDNYAVVKIAHRQYIVEPDKIYAVDKFAGEEGAKVELEVLAKSVDGNLEFGEPVAKNAKVVVEILDQGKGDKITTDKFKAKARYRKRTGHRERITTFKVIELK